ncbi:hypothetical protein K3495_g6244 [Podosphaera aphanis]|nr:hypothetical protein K3495_g6244 [Podosphaera aphanis]
MAASPKAGLPITEPAASARPIAAPDLTPEETSKYQRLLDIVKSWKEVPSNKGNQGSLTDDDILWLTRDCLLRYLRATKWDIDVAAKRLLCTLTWRREFGVEDITGDYIGAENQSGKQVLLGFDNEARPCHYMIPGLQNTESGPKQVQHLVFMVERVIDFMVPEQDKMTLLIDLKSGAKTMPNMGQSKQVLDIIQNHYPERLGRAIVVNVPWIVNGFFKLIMPFIDPMTREKLKFNEDLRNFIPGEQLWKRYQGDLEFDYAHEVYWPALLKICEEKRASYRERWVRAGKCVGECESYLKGGDSPSVSQQ